MKQLLFLLTISFLSLQLYGQSKDVKSIISRLKNSQGTDVLVAAHRGDWRSAPENSLLAISNAIEMGVDIVEIDVRKTKDGHLIIIHDETVDRTTNGKGHVKDLTLDSIKRLHLKNGLGRVTYHTIPTLEEAMLALKGKAMVNLDKCYKYLEEAYKILEKTGTVEHAIFKGYSKKAHEVKKDYGHLLDKIHYMAMVKLDDPDALTTIIDFQKEIRPVAFELSFTQDTARVFKSFGRIKETGARIWVNSLWANLNAGHDDDLAESTPHATYGWIRGIGANIIQTDRPEALIRYLKNNPSKTVARKLK